MVEEESVKAVRSASRLLVLFSCIALVLAFSPEEKNTYKEAVGEINALLALDVQPLLIKGAQENKRVRDNLMRAKSIAAQQGLSFSATGKPGEIICIEPQPIDLPLLEMVSIDSFLLNFNKLTVTLVEIDVEFESELKDFLAKNYNPKWGKNVRLLINQDHPKPFYNLVFGNLSTGAALTHSLAKDTITLPFDMMRSLRDYDKDHLLFAKIDGDYVFVPNLKHVWEQIRTETPINARTILARKDITQERRIAVLGLSLPERLISWTMPGLIFALSVYFLVYVLHLSHLSKTTPSIKDYPWVGVIPGYLSSIVSGVMYFLLPVTAFFSVSYASWSGHTYVIHSLLIAFAMGTILALAAANVQLYQISHSTLKSIRPEETGLNDRKQLDEKT